MGIIPMYYNAFIHFLNSYFNTKNTVIVHTVKLCNNTGLKQIFNEYS